METQKGVFMGLKTSAGKSWGNQSAAFSTGTGWQEAQAAGRLAQQAAVCTAMGFRSGQEAVRFGSRVLATGRGDHSNNNI